MAATDKRVGVVLAGCGFLDGAEIQEALLTLLSLDRRQAKVIPLAPKIDQMHVVDHAVQRPVEGARRSVFEEAARITRGELRDLASVGADDLDALIFPGGYGVAKNLCTFATEGTKLRVQPDVERIIRAVHAAGKPMGFICIAPVLAAKVLGDRHPVLTIGDDPQTASALEALGARHVVRAVDDIAVDPALKLVSTPAWMLGPSIAPIAQGIDKLVSAVLEQA